MNTATPFDIVIIGGGMTGAALACALGGTRWRIAVIEGQAPITDWPADGFDLRVSAITRASQQLFRRLGVWEAIVDMRVAPYREMQVWDAGGPGSIHFDSAEIGEPDLGHIIENRVITRALAQRMAQFPNISVICPAAPTRLRLRPDGSSELQLEDGARLTARLIVGADGAASWVREQAGIALDVRHYGQRAVVATVNVERGHQDTAWQRFLPSGPLAFLPLMGDYCSIVWSTTPEQAAALLAMTDAAFAHAVSEAFEHRLGAVTPVGPRAAFALQGQHARAYVKPGLALVGDAAHTIHPLAGQGVNLGFADVACLTDVLLKAPGDNPGSHKLLRRYERTRRGDNHLTLEAMGLLKHLFGSDSPWLADLRNVGLDLVDRLTIAKRFFMQQAMGRQP